MDIQFPLARATRSPTLLRTVSQPPSNDKSRRAPSARKPVAAGILGIGLDNEDGHKRVTTAEQFAIVGGSEETHGRMTETLVKTFEELKHRGKHLAQVERAELTEIIHKSTPR